MLELINPKERRGNEGIKSRRGVMERGRKGEGKVAKSRPSTLADMQLAHPIGGDVASHENNPNVFCPDSRIP